MSLNLLSPKHTRFWPDDFLLAAKYNLLGAIIAGVLLFFDWPVVAFCVSVILLIRAKNQRWSGVVRYHGIIIERRALAELDDVIKNGGYAGRVNMITDAPVLYRGREYGNLDAVLAIERADGIALPTVILEIKSFDDVTVGAGGTLMRTEHVGWLAGRRFMSQLWLQRKAVPGRSLTVVWCPDSPRAISAQRGFLYIGGSATWLLAETLRHANEVYREQENRKPRCIFVKFPSMPPERVRNSLKDLGFRWIGGEWQLRVATGNAASAIVAALEEPLQAHNATYRIVLM